jgi:hypothetical protein
MKDYDYERGIAEAVEQCAGAVNNWEGIQSDIYRAVNPKKNVRTYLYPAVIFNNLIDLKPAVEELRFETVIEDLVYKYSGVECNLIVASFGIFIPHENRGETKDRSVITAEVLDVLSKLQIDAFNINQNYVMEARKDLWLY